MKYLLAALVMIILVINFVSAQPPDTLWTRTYGGISADYGQCIEQTTDGGFIIAGYGSSYLPPDDDAYLIKTDANGDTIWMRIYGSVNGDYCWDVKQTTDGGYIFTGSNSNDLWLVKTNALGDTLWSRVYGGGSGDVGKSVEQTFDGGYIVTGYTTSFGAGNYDIYTVRLDTTGDTLWTRTYGGILSDESYDVIQSNDGNYVLVGLTYSYGIGSRNIYLLKINTNGDTLWTRTYGQGDDAGMSVQQTTDGGYIIGGFTSAEGAGENDYYLVKTDSLGNIIWTNTFGGPNQEFGGQTIQTPDCGYIISGHTSSYGSGSYDLYLVKTNDLGNEEWATTLGSAQADYCNRVALTSDNGYVTIGTTYSDFWVVRFAGQPLEVILTPHNPPIQIPSGGGSFQFDCEITNQSQIDYTIDVWTDITLPGGTTYPIIIRNNLNLPAGGAIIRNNLTQYVPATALPGTYQYNAHIRDHNTWQVLAEDSFPFEKLAGDNTPNHALGWLLLGWDEPLTQITPMEFALKPNHPNPFNLITTISFTLPQASYITLKVYDLAGRQIAELANKFLSAGRYTYAFNGTNLSSGIYIAKLQAGEYQASQKMILLK